MKFHPYAPFIVALALASGCDSPSGSSEVVPPVPGPTPRSANRPVKIDLDSLHFVVINSHAQLRAVVRDIRGNVVPNAQIVWSIQGEPIATIDPSGTVSVKRNGKAKVIAESAYLDGTRIADTIPLVVRQVVTGLAVVPGRLGMYVGDTAEMSVVAYDGLRWPVADAVVTWRSSAPGVLSITPAGGATGLAAGSSTATATVPTFAGNATLSTTVEVNVAGAGTYVQVRSGGALTCGLVRGGDVFCWGERGGTMLSDGTRLSGDVPTRVSTEEKFVAIDVGYFHACGLTATGSAFCWGGNLFGQLGNGDGGTEGSRRDTPQRVAGGMTFTRIAAGVTHSCGVTVGGDAFCWGSNDYGELGSGSPMSGRYNKQPTPVEGGVKFAEITAGNRHSCGLTSQGAAYCWGSDAGRKLGTPEPWYQGLAVPTRAATGYVFSAIYAVGDHTCAQTAQNLVYCWGGWVDYVANMPSSRSAPTQIGPGVEFASIADGNDSMCGVTRSGAAYCWRAGDGVPLVRVPGTVAFASLSPGRDRTCGVGTDARIYCWGPGGVGGMGDGRSTGSAVPVGVSPPF